MKNKKNAAIVFFMFILPALVFGQMSSNALKPPAAKINPHTTTLHGETLVDNYFWLREKTNPEVISYLEAENKYTEALSKSFVGLQDKIYNEILSRIKQTDLSVPYKLGEYWYYTRTEEGKQYAIYCRKPGSMEAAEQIVLDLNELAQGHKFLGLGLYQVSDDGNLLAYSLDTTGFRQYKLQFKDLRSGQTLSDSIGQVNSAVWAADNQTLFYIKEDHAKRAYRFYRHVLGNKQDQLLYEETDELYNIFTYRSSDRQFIFLGASSSETSEIQYLRSDQPSGAFKILAPREFDHEYYVDHRDKLFYIRTNKNAKNYRLVTAPEANPEAANWKELRPHRTNVTLEGTTLFKDHIVFNERENGLLKLRVHDFRSGKTQDIAFPEPVYSAFSNVNPEFNSKVYRYSYQSFVTPSSIFDYDMETGKSKLLKQTEVLGGYDAKQYQSERIYAKATDGTMIPISLVYKKGMKRNGANPLLLYGYGSYGAASAVTFSIPRLSLLERGVVYAIGHIRGGGDLGEMWHDDGKMMKKKNTFTDFIACAEHLIREKYTSKEHLAIQGGSAGGLLIGATVNMRPDLFKAAHLAVPFVDVINTMLDESLPLTVGEFLEWGNPKKKAEYDYLKTYCPYTNIANKTYPNMLVTTSLNDSQVMYWEPAKYVAKMRATRTDNNMLLLKTNMGAGHGGASGRYDAYKEQAFIFAFILNQLGVEKGAPPTP